MITEYTYNICVYTYFNLLILRVLNQNSEPMIHYYIERKFECLATIIIHFKNIPKTTITERASRIPNNTPSVPPRTDVLFVFMPIKSN